MADTQQKIIDAQACELEKLRAARSVPNTAASDLAGVLNFSNAALQTNKNALETKNAALVRDLASANQEIARISQRNIFVETELEAARLLFQQAIPGHEELKQQNTMLIGNIATLQHERFLREQEVNILRQRIHVLEVDTKNLLADNVGLRTICFNWAAYSAKQDADIEALSQQAQIMHESLVRKEWRLSVQKTYLDKAGLTVEEFKTDDDLAAGIRAVQELQKRENVAKTLLENDIAKNVSTETVKADGTASKTEEARDLTDEIEDVEEVMCESENGGQAREQAALK